MGNKTVSQKPVRTDNRPKPMTPKAGYTVKRRRYGDGGTTSK